jgi:hypothetical protein
MFRQFAGECASLELPKNTITEGTQQTSKEKKGQRLARRLLTGHIPLGVRFSTTKGREREK